MLNATLSFDPSSISNAASGTIEVMILVSWLPPDTPNGVIVDQSVMVQSSDGVVVFSNESIGSTVRNLSIAMATVDPNGMYFATVTVTNGGGSRETNTTLVTAPQGGKK